MEVVSLGPYSCNLANFPLIWRFIILNLFALEDLSIDAPNSHELLSSHHTRIQARQNTIVDDFVVEMGEKSN